MGLFRATTALGISLLLLLGCSTHAFVLRSTGSNECQLRTADGTLSARMQRFTTAFSWTKVPGLEIFNTSAGEATLAALSSSATHVSLAVDHPTNETTSLWNWGCFDGELDESTGQPVPSSLAEITSVPSACVNSGVAHLVTGNYFTCAVCNTDLDNITCWYKTDSPVTIAGSTLGLSGVQKLAAGVEHVCALFSTSEDLPGQPVVACFGSNEWGALGNTDDLTPGFNTELKPVVFSPFVSSASIPADLAYPVVLNCGPYQCIVTFVDQTNAETHIWTWGYGSTWNLGFNPSEGVNNIFAPRRVENLPWNSGYARDAYVTEYAGFFLSSVSNQTYSWGDLGLGVAGAGLNLPVQIDPEFSVVTEELADVAVFEGKSIEAIRRVGESVIAKVEGDNRVYGWGANYYIELAYGPYAATVPSPRLLPGRTRRSSVAPFSSVFVGERNLFMLE